MLEALRKPPGQRGEMARATLTALAVERAHRSGEPVLLSDGDGLYLRKQTRDGASWTLRYRFAGRQHWLTLGNYPDMPLAQARIEARQARVVLDRQQDPLTVRRAALAEERQKGSFKSLCEDWYCAEVQARGLKHPAVPRRYLDKYLLHFTRRIFAFGVRRRFLSSNPAADFSPRLDAGGTELPRNRALGGVRSRRAFAVWRSVAPAGGENQDGRGSECTAGVRGARLASAPADAGCHQRIRLPEAPPGPAREGAARRRGHAQCGPATREAWSTAFHASRSAPDRTHASGRARCPPRSGRTMPWP